MDEVADEAVLGFTDRGTHTTLTCHPGRKVESNYGMNIIDICPVGALTSKDFRFQMRVWFLKETKSIDVNCGTGCNTTLWTRGNEVFRVTPRQNDAVNSTWMPDSHRLSFHSIHSDTRLTDAMVKVEGQHDTVSGTDAIEAATDALQQFAGSEIAIIASGRQTNEELYLTHSLAKATEAKYLSIIPRTGEADDQLISADRNPNTTGAGILLDVDNPSSTLDKIQTSITSSEIKALVIFGEDLLEDTYLTKEDLSNLEFIIYAGTHANHTAEMADIILPTATFAEKRGSMVNVSGRLQRLNAAIIPPGNAQDDWETIRDLCNSITGENNQLYMLEDVFKRIATTYDAFQGMTLSKIGAQGVVIKETGVTIPLVEREKKRIANREIVG